MNQLKIREINRLHANGFVILQANKSTNAPIGWKHKDGSVIKWGYTEEMADPKLEVYKKTFNTELIMKSHCGFYLGHNQLCCIDLDTKKTTIKETRKLKDLILKKLGKRIAIETTKSNGFHIYFRHKILPNVPDFMAKGKDNWIELYYSKRFIACYLSNTGLYKLEHGDIDKLTELTDGEHKSLLGILKPYAGKITKRKATKRSVVSVDENTRLQVESYIEQITTKGLDITGDNPKWFKIGKALANAFGDKGFDYFNAISQFSDKYNADTIQQDYDRFLTDDKKDRQDKVTISTFIKYCDDAGLYDIKTLQIANAQTEEREFELIIQEKEKMPDVVHAVCNGFISIAPICCMDKKTFYMFKNTHWVRLNEREVTELVIDYCRRSTVSPKILRSIETFPYKQAILAELGLVTMVDTITPNTGDLKNGININLNNGILHVDLNTGKRKLLDHSPAYNFTGVLPYNYEIESLCPKFDAWMDNQIPDKESQTTYYAFIASCLTKHKADIILMLAGGTSTGKSSLIEITRRLVGIENSVPVSASTLFGGGSDGQTIAMQMENKLLAYDFDAQPFKTLEVLLKVAAQEPIMGWQMGIARRPVTNYGRLMIAMNPHNYSIFTPAVARRFITVRMDVQVKKDNSVIPDIYENELAGIFLKVLNVGMKHLINNNGQILVSEKMQKNTLDFHIGQRDSIRWFNKHYEIPIVPKDNSKRLTKMKKYENCNKDKHIIRVGVSELYRLYRAWMEDVEGFQTNRIQVRKHFAQDLELLGIQDAKDAESNLYCVYLIQKQND